MNTEQFSTDLSTIKDVIGKVESLVGQKEKKGRPPASPLKTTALLKTEEDVFAALNERVAQQCAPGLWAKVQDSMKANYCRDERRVWRQIVAAIRANDEAEASRLAKATGIPVKFLKS